MTKRGKRVQLRLVEPPSAARRRAEEEAAKPLWWSIEAADVEVQASRRALSRALLERAQRHAWDAPERRAGIEAALEVDPRNARGWYELSTVLLDDVGASLAAATRAVELEPGSADCYANRAAQLRHAGFEARALADLHRAVRLEPSCFHWLERARTYVALGQAKEAFADFKAAMAKEPDWSGFLREVLDAARELGDDVLGRELDAATARYPDHASVWFHRGFWHLRAQQWTEALGAFKRGSQGDEWGQVIQADVHRRMGDLEVARTTLDRVIEKRPQCDWILMRRAVCLAELGDRAAALADLDRAIALDARAEFLVWRARVGGSPASQKDLRAAIRLAPEVASHQVDLAEAQFDAGNRRGALTALSRATKLFTRPQEAPRVTHAWLTHLGELGLDLCLPPRRTPADARALAKQVRAATTLFPRLGT